MIVVLLLSGGGSRYEVTAHFENASQLVDGNVVTVGGTEVGLVDSIELGHHGEALVRFHVDDAYAPLKQGTTATIRSFSLSGVANREVQLTLPPEGHGGDPIPSGGDLGQSDTVSEVDLDQIFNMLNDRHRRQPQEGDQGL